MNSPFIVSSVFVLIALLICSASGELVISGNGGLALEQEGPQGPTAPGVGNVAAGKTVFFLNTHPADPHKDAKVTDGIYGNGSSWLGITQSTYVGIDLASSTSINKVAFGRSNVITGDPCAGGVCTDRWTGIYTLQYTTVANPNVNTTNWTTIGDLNYQSAGGPNFANPHRRHVYSFTAVNATGIRIKTQAPDDQGGSWMAIDEIELYSPPPAEPPAAYSYTTPATYTIGEAITTNAPSSSDDGISYAVVPALPAGLTLDQNSGEITGTPTVVAAMANYVVTATNEGGSTTATLTITVIEMPVSPPTSLAYSAPSATYTVGETLPPNTPTSSGGAVNSYSVSPALPAGLMLNTSTGVISGTPGELIPATAYS
ncbi:MAG: hypothetical protein ACI9R3_006270, partial [Verrucomicrobiales bacterium]